MLHNLFGDFVRGSDLSHYPKDAQVGIRLHRAIDDFMDRHEKVLDVVHHLHKELPKIGAVAMDLYFDHLLAKRWNTYHNQSYGAYLKVFYESVDVSSNYFGLAFQLFIQKLIRYDWMSYYPTLEGLDKACRGVSLRLSFPNELVNGKDVFVANEQLIADAFEVYMRDAIENFHIVNSK